MVVLVRQPAIQGGAAQCPCLAEAVLLLVIIVIFRTISDLGGTRSSDGPVEAVVAVFKEAIERVDCGDELRVEQPGPIQQDHRCKQAPGSPGHPPVVRVIGRVGHPPRTVGNETPIIAAKRAGEPRTAPRFSRIAIFFNA